MGEFNRAVEFLKKEDLNEQDWIFLADAIRSIMWSEECHDHLRKALELYRRDADLYSIIP